MEKKQPEDEEDLETLKELEKKLEINFFENKDNEDQTKPRNSLEFLEKQEEIMKSFQDNFINIYEGKPLDISDKKTVKMNHEEEEEKEIKTSFEKKKSILLEKKETKKPKNQKKHKIQKVLQEINKKKAHKKSENKNNIKERDCCNSKIIKKPEKVHDDHLKILIFM